MNVILFECEGKQHQCTSKAKFLLEIANGTSSYSLVRGFADPFEAIKHYGFIVPEGSLKKRLTMIDGGKRTVLARTK